MLEECLLNIPLWNGIYFTIVTVNVVSELIHVSRIDVEEIHTEIMLKSFHVKIGFKHFINF